MLLLVFLYREVLTLQLHDRICVETEVFVPAM